ncbi:MAG TPA: aldo/keto reductase [Candidatus Acidoferrum sp.]|nr:aldo/keto reductase [Candidatus Acidoferrum sp.]
MNQRKLGNHGLNISEKFKKPEDLEPGDWRRNSLRLQGENFQRNLKFAERAEGLARRKKRNPAQLALAWVLAQGENIVPIPGTKRRRYLQENVAALQLEMTLADLEEISTALPASLAAGPRYPEQAMQAMQAVNR